MLIFVDHVTERLQFVLEFVFRQHGIPYELTNDLSLFVAAETPKCSYSDYPFDGVVSVIHPHRLLFEEHLRTKPKLELSSWHSTECLAIDGMCDPLAAIFFVISRYEEYVSVQRDKHDRFTAKSSLLYRFGWLNQAIAERWSTAIYRFLDPEGTSLIPERSVTFIPSFDIDNTFAYKWKDGWRYLLSELKDRLRGNQERRMLRKQVRSGQAADPFDTFTQIQACATEFPATRVFWLLADWGEYDRNISWTDLRHQRLIRTIGQKAKIGLHPGYASNVSDKRLLEEKQRLAQITGTAVRESRQHFLKLRLPHTYRRLIAEGFQADFTMGFADQPGFRLGTARPVFFFDLESNQQTAYQLFPFAYMDGTFNEYVQCSPDEAKATIEQLFGEVVRFGGVFCFIWHNETIGETGRWKGWSEVFHFTLELARKQHE